MTGFLLNLGLFGAVVMVWLYRGEPSCLVAGPIVAFCAGWCIGLWAGRQK